MVLKLRPPIKKTKLAHAYALGNVNQSKHGGVYIIQNVETGKAVIGQTTALKGRFNQYSSRAARADMQSDSINKGYYLDAQAAIPRVGSVNKLFQRFIVYSWIQENGESADFQNSIDLTNEMLYLEHRLILAFYECDLAYNTKDSAPQLNKTIKLDLSLTKGEKTRQPVGGLKETKPFKFVAPCECAGASLVFLMGV